MNDVVVAELIEDGRAPVFFFVDHASNHVPDEFEGLGLDAALRATHVGWDIGAEALARNLSRRLQATALFCRFSRLLIDPNRALGNPGLIPETSDAISIPGNIGLSKQQRQKRIDTFYRPYHEQLGRALDLVQSAHADPLIVSVHSFTPQLSATAQPRPWHISKLWKDDPETAHALITFLRTETNYVIGDNEPYSGQEYNFTVDRHIGPRGLRHATFEVRQDMISTLETVEMIGETLASAIAGLL